MSPKCRVPGRADRGFELADWQVQIGGLALLGPGTLLPIGEIEGLGAPEVRPQDVDNPTGDGTLAGVDYYGPRTVRIEAGIRTPGDPSAAMRELERLQRAARAEEVRVQTGKLSVLRARWPGHRTRRLYGRVRRMEATSTASAVHGWIPLDIEYVAMDPLFHADAATHVPLNLDQTARPGRIHHDGDAAAWPSIRVNGPVMDPKIWNTATGEALDLRLSLRAGEHLDIETLPGTRWLLRNSTTNAANALAPCSRLDRFTIPPGDSEIAWSGTDPTATSSVVVSWRPAYTTL